MRFTGGRVGDREREGFFFYFVFLVFVLSCVVFISLGFIGVFVLRKVYLGK